MAKRGKCGSNSKKSKNKSERIHYSVSTTQPSEAKIVTKYLTNDLKRFQGTLGLFFKTGDIKSLTLSMKGMTEVLKEHEAYLNASGKYLCKMCEQFSGVADPVDQKRLIGEISKKVSKSSIFLSQEDGLSFKELQNDPTSVI